MQQKSTVDKTFFISSLNSSRKCELNTKLFSSQIWDALTLLPYRKVSSRIIDRAILARKGGDHE